jgi:hypothetical protein
MTYGQEELLGSNLQGLGFGGFEILGISSKRGSG